MQLPEIYAKLKELEKLIDPQEINILSAYISGFITDYEEELHELNLAVSNEWLKLREQSKSSVEADRKLDISPIHQKRERTRLNISQLKRMRSDLKDRFQVLTNIKRF